MPRGKCLFSERWLYNPQYSDWLVRASNKVNARCKVCMKEFDVSNMGETALTSHLKGAKHKTLMEQKDKATGCTIQNLFSTKANQNVTETRRQPSTSAHTPCRSTSTVTISDFVTRNETLESEIIWALKVVDCHYSFKSSESSSILFQRMFPDSQLATKFACGETKCKYLCCFGIAPYFQNLMLEKVKKENNYVLLFDESLNHKTQSKQLDVHVRLWEGDQVNTRFFTSQFIGHATANDLVNHFHDSVHDLALSRLLQVSMDGPNVNWAFYDKLDAELKRDFNISMLNVGSCGLHTLHNAFKAGGVASDWRIDQLLSSLYYLFKDSPARREDYTTLIGTKDGEILPLKFCKHRWLENLPVVERALKIWPNICVYVQAVQQKKLKDPKTKSFDVVKSCVKDNFILAKLASFKSIAAELQPFLTLYQTDKPMIPFLSTDLERIHKNLLERFIKPELLKDMTPQALAKLDFGDKKNHCDLKNVKLGFKAESAINDLKLKKKVSELQVLEFRTQCKQFLQSVVKKILDKSPIKYSLVRNLTFLDPRNLANDKHNCERKLKQTLRILIGANRVDETKCDEVIRQLGHFIDEVVSSKFTDFSEFSPSLNRVDSILYDNMATSDRYKDLWSVVKPLLLLSHGQASVERGFSVNKQIEVENLLEENYIALRRITDHIQHVGGIFNVKVDKPLLLSAAGARQKYHSYLDDLRRKKLASQENLRRKSIDDDISDLKVKRRCLLKDIEEMMRSADKFSEKAESTRNFSFIAKANSLRRSAKDKETELGDIDVKLDDKVKELKNS